MKKRKLLLLSILIFVLLFTENRLESSAAGEGYHIYINVAANVVTVYLDNSPVRAMITSTGTATPLSGTYKLSDKYRWGYLVGNVYGQYCTRITGGILFHSVPYTAYRNAGSLKHGQFDLLGTPASLGCMRLCVGDAKWIYDNIPAGTPVTFYSDAEHPSALGVPYAAKLEHFGQPLAGWDPTDTDPANPWNAYLGAAFNAQQYLTYNPDIAGLYPWTDESLKLHWLTSGIAEGRRASAGFSLSEYKNAHPELAASLGDNNYAWVEQYNRGAVAVNAAGFDAVAYANRYPDLKAAFGYNHDLLWDHYLRYGIYEGRIATR